MNELPELAIWLISEHLNYEDVRNLRLTCKRLKEAIDQRRFDSLHLFVGEFPFERDLFGTNELVNYSNTLRIDSLGILSSAKFKGQFSGLTKLSIYFDTYRDLDYSKKVTLNDLNSFVHLLHLEVLGLDLENGKLCLPNLKIASFDNDKFHSPEFELHCPQLNALRLAKGTQPKLTPETRRSIRHLSMYVSCVRVTEHPYRSYELDLYDQLNNLSTVSFRDCEQAERFVRDLIDRKVRVPSLKRIQLIDATNYTEAILESFILFKSSKETKHIEFQINWKVMNLDGLIQIRDFEIRHPKSLISLWAYARKNMRHLAENPILDCLIRDVLYLYFNHNEDAPFLRQLMDKLGHLKEVEIGKEVSLNEDLFECLLRKGRRIRSLTIRSNRLTQQHLDRMPGYLTDLRNLIFEHGADLSEMNFDFVAKFNLLSVTFCFRIQKETMISLFKRFKCEPNSRLIVYGAQTVCIDSQPNENGRFEIVCSPFRYVLEEEKIKKIEFVSLEAAIDLYYENDLFNKKIEAKIEANTASQ